ncbi:crotonobetainyl-CoA:carnitine CoA-transferase CaiB-like acyl-CoA transferase [Novosphingobium kunmingense]|uniref:Crotonobetainyl-CoA:carnitine CoA-transferase CaiB-like acyl-CoA transferase n=1 Tax=Novosphingobium kunmingense TaxID=1211806 RepID=A0A2N0H785_9SPHN|nr:CoA transferase [Novosphingobium kunmingense]PKB14798.1 crotonobetainyl-CoA:carnitine CoA-transferase CaiB-like acyl-CoA transferase [Novosphingobium kunmingense]
MTSAANVAGDGAPAMLEGIRVLDLTTVVFGPYCTQTLADLGADVIKVESPGSGDAFRWSARAAATPGMSPGFMAFNRGKRSLALDLKQEDDLARMKDLLVKADVFVVNVRGKALERLGLDYEAVRAINPDIVYVHCVGFGQDGPYADLQAYDDVIQAATGTATLLPRVDGDARPRYLPSLIADKVAGLHAAYASLAALLHRQRTGEGQRVEVPMFEAFSHFMLSEHLGGRSFTPALGPAGYARQLDPDRQPFPTSDGHISIVAYTDDAWSRIFALLDEPDFLAEPRFATARDRVRNQAALYQGMAALTPRFTTEDLLGRCAAAQIPAQAVRDLDAMLDDPHLNGVDFFRRRQHPSEGGYVEMRAPVAFSARPGIDPLPPPRLGEHADARWNGQPSG